MGELSDIERVVLITVDCLRWDFHEQYRDLYPDGYWFRGTPQANVTPTSHYSLFTGLNPQRHGAIGFGSSYHGDSLFTESNSISLSPIHTQPLVHDDSVTVGESYRPFNTLIDIGCGSSVYQFNYEGAVDMFEKIREHDVTFIHDWIVHGSGEAHRREDWTRTIDINDPVSKNIDRYQYHVDLSVESHEYLLDEMKDAGLYENTLFVVWGDHGQSLGEDDQVNHGDEPTPFNAQVPISFTSTVFDDTTVDTKTNARGVDVLPTLMSILDDSKVYIGDMSHEMEGVDLTSFDGELIGYTMSSVHYNYNSVFARGYEMTADGFGKYSLFDVGEDSPFTYDRVHTPQVSAFLGEELRKFDNERYRGVLEQRNN